MLLLKRLWKSSDLEIVLDKCNRLVVKVHQLLAQGRWFFPDTPASSTTKTGRHDIAEILLKVALNTNNSKFKFKIIFAWTTSLLLLSNTISKSDDFQSRFSSNMTGTTSEAGLLTSLEHPNSGATYLSGAPRPVLVVEEAGVSGKNHRPWASNWWTLSLAAASRVHPFL
jgi:hypothetical protein